MRIGIRSATMDDIARELGISKKTIYQYFSNKAEIVQAVCLSHCVHNEAEVKQFTAQAENAIDELARLFQWVQIKLTQSSPSLIHELQKFYPEAWDMMRAHDHGYVLGKIMDNLRWGMREGLYRAELDVEILARMRLAQIESTFNASLFPTPFEPAAVQRELLLFYLHGISTPKGKTLVLQYFNPETFSTSS